MGILDAGARRRTAASGVFLGMVADTTEAATAVSLKDMLLRLEEADVTLRIGRAATPTIRQGARAGDEVGGHHTVVDPQ